MSSQPFWSKRVVGQAERQAGALIRMPGAAMPPCYGCGKPTNGISHRGNPQCPRCRQEALALDAMADRQGRTAAARELKADLKRLAGINRPRQRLGVGDWIVLLFVLGGLAYLGYTWGGALLAWIGVQ